MEKIKIGKENKAHGYFMKASAYEYSQGIYGYILTDEEADETCFFGNGNTIYSTCDPDNCKWYEKR